MPMWIKMQKETVSIRTDLGQSQSTAPTYEQLNAKQKVAFQILDAHIQDAKINGLAGLKQLLLNISGGAGTGKSFWLNAVRAHATAHLNQSFVKSAAPSGTAAYLVNGETLHSLLYLPIGKTKLEPLQGERLADVQRRFLNVGVLIIDEKSMVGQEIFWMVSERLKQARPQGCGEPFGGLSVVLLGDWKQLPPVGDSPLYNGSAKNPRGYNLYQLFKEVVIFEQVQRQLGDHQALFRQELQSLGNGTFTEDSWQRWKARALDQLPPAEQDCFRKDAILACALKGDMLQHNIAKVKANGQPIAPIYADSAPKEACRSSAERACGLGSKIVLSKKSIFRLTSNLWTQAGLTNGAVGTVYAIIYAEGEKPPALPVGIIGIFQDYKGPSYLPDIANAVPIVPVCREWFSNKIHCSRTMLPIILGYAITIHKLQGQTCAKLILNPGNSEFASGLLLVGATRTTSFEGLAFAPFPNFSRFEQVNKCKGLKLRLKEEKRMEVLEMATLGKFSLELANLQGIDSPTAEISSHQQSMLVEGDDLMVKPTSSLLIPSSEDCQPVASSIMQGVSWGIGEVRNSCTIDNFLTLILFRADLFQRNLGESPVEQLLKEITALLVGGDQIGAKILWVNYLFQEQGIAEVKIGPGQYDTFGTEQRMLYSALGQIQQIRSTSKCADCTGEKIQHLNQFLLQATDDIVTYLQFFEIHFRLGACPQCLGPNLIGGGLNFVHPCPWLFVINVEENHTIREIIKAPTVISICGQVFYLAMVSLQKDSHFTSLLWNSTGWHYYDGISNGARIRKELLPMKKLEQHKPIHIVYLRLIF